MDPAKLKAEKQERERQLRLIREAAEEALRSKILAEENRQRLHHLVQSGDIFRVHDEDLVKFLQAEQIRQDWENFISCSPLPELTKLSHINTFFAEWVLNCVHPDTNLETVFKYTPEILQLLDKMQMFLEFPPDTIPVEHLVEMGITYHEIKRRQQAAIDQSSYNILADTRGLYDPEVGIIEFEQGIPEVVHCLWSNTYSCPEYTGYHFPGVDFRFKIPEVLVLQLGVYRLVKLEYDPYSDSSSSYFPPGATHFLKASIQNWIWKEEGSLLSISKSSEFPQVDGDGGAEGIGGLEAVNEEQVSETFLLRRKWKSMTMRNKETEEPRRQQGKSSGGSEASIPGGQTTNATTTPTALSDTLPDPEVVKGTQAQVEAGGEEVMSQDDESAGNPNVKDKTNEQGLEGVPTGPETEESRDRSIESEKKTRKEDEEIHVETTTTTEPEKKGRRGKGGKGDETGGRTKTEAELAKERERKEKASFLPTRVHPDELNLRNHRVLGGIYDFQLLQLPPQPIDPQEDACWTLHDIESVVGLAEVPFEADYVTPTSSDLHEVKRTPEEMEKEAKRQEEELQKLVLVEIKVPKSALWFEPPTIVRWNKKLRIWSSQGFSDPRFNEDSLQLSFRMSGFGIIGLGHNRWSNLPYQSWEVRPQGTNGVIIGLMAAVAVLEFTVKDDLVCMSSLQNVGNGDMVEMALAGKYMKPRELIHTLRCHGLDVFPEADSYAYVDGILVKFPEAEDHLYQCMATVCSAFNFHWSRWNLLAGRSKMVYQIRERHGTTTPGNYQMVLNTPRSVALIDCTEVSPNYSEEQVGEYEYHADLLHLVHSIASEGAKARMAASSGEFIETVRQLLTAIKLLSFA